MDDAELKKATAIEVMGFIECYHNGMACWCLGGDYDMVMPQSEWLQDWNANHWMMVVGRMGELGWLPVISRKETGEWYVLFNKIVSGAGTEPDKLLLAGHEDIVIGRAVCEASLKAVGG